MSTIARRLAAVEARLDPAAGTIAAIADATGFHPGELEAEARRLAETYGAGDALIAGVAAELDIAPETLRADAAEIMRKAGIWLD